MTMTMKRRNVVHNEPKLVGLADARGRRLITQRTLAERSGVPQPSISALERLHRGAQIVTIHKLARALNVDPRVLTGERRE